jgi:prevent-host-death family protein
MRRVLASPRESLAPVSYGFRRLPAPMGWAGAKGGVSGLRSLTSDKSATMKHMSTVGIRALKQNASAVVAEAVAGETVTITDRGRPVAQLIAIPASRLQSLIDLGRARVGRHDITEIPVPTSDLAVTAALLEMRNAERY